MNTNRKGKQVEQATENLMKRIGEVKVVLATLIDLVAEAESNAGGTKWAEEKEAFLSEALNSVANRCDYLAYDLAFANDGDSILRSSERVDN